MSRVLRHPEDYPFSGCDLLVLLLLADYANGDGFCWPSIDRIAYETRMSRASVIRAKRALMDGGVIEQVVMGRGRGYQFVEQVAGCDRSQDATGRNSGADRSHPATSPAINGPAKDPPRRASAGEGDSHRRPAHPDPKPPTKERKPRKGLGGPEPRAREKREPFVPRMVQVNEQLDAMIRGEA